MASSIEECNKSKSRLKLDSLESLKEISSQFFEMVPVRRMRWKDDDAAMMVACPDLQVELLNATVRHPVCHDFPPALSYRRYFMKLLIQKLEAQDADVADEVYEAYTDLLSRPEDEDETLCFKSYALPSGEYVSLQESVHLVSQGTTGLSTWQAAQHLAEWILENPQVVNNRTVTELGCGLGFTGIIVCKCCQVQSYTFTDCHSQVLYLLSNNINQNLGTDKHTSEFKDSSNDREKRMLRKIRRQLSQSSNGDNSGYSDNNADLDSITKLADSDQICTCEDEDLTIEPVDLNLNPEKWGTDSSSLLASYRHDSRVRLCHLDWEWVKEKQLEELQADVILAADVVYDLSIIPALVLVLKALLYGGANSNRKPRAFIASTIRNEDSRDAFLIAMASEGLNYSVLENPKQQRYFYDRSVPIEILEFYAT
ncbi:hypothetical protein RRG08_031733 [Elysia crispata]|uniref:FAM86 N-terminal domain-containing protein n=1 Tax=Elysia crispata TaxID=231223 RepID=A0AAE0ZF68_9GAST|nr:hypothetical protein RRG08_031733 [Elysia crispata]